MAGSPSPPQHQHTRSVDTPITIYEKVLGNAAALQEETPHPESTLINAERGGGFVEIVSGNCAFTREKTVHICGVWVSATRAPCDIEVGENVAPPEGIRRWDKIRRDQE